MRKLLTIQKGPDLSCQNNLSSRRNLGLWPSGPQGLPVGRPQGGASICDDHKESDFWPPPSPIVRNCSILQYRIHAYSYFFLWSPPTSSADIIHGSSIGFVMVIKVACHSLHHSLPLRIFSQWRIANSQHANRSIGQCSNLHLLNWDSILGYRGISYKSPYLDRPWQVGRN